MVSILIVGYAMASADVFELFYEFSRAHEDWELDDYVVTLLISPVFLLLFATQRVKDILRQQELEHARKEAEFEKAQALAGQDVLTGLPNRLLFSDRVNNSMAQAMRHGNKIAVVFIDLDKFKPINDFNGHNAGNQFLIKIAHKISNGLRAGDTIARFGGDEFVILFNDLENTRDVIPMLDRLLNLITEPLAVTDSHPLSVTASMGVSIYPQSEETHVDVLLRQSDQAMYQAKLLGGNRYHFFDEEFERKMRGQHEDIERIRKAILTDEFITYFQPKLDIESGEIVGAEALIRWEHPEQGFMPPKCFLPVIENHPLSIDLDMWIFENVMKQLENWKAKELDIPVSINVSAFFLQQDNFVTLLADLLARHPEVNPGLLTLEVLETTALEDLENVSRLMGAAKEIGVHFSLDDFGTGYSSLSYLKRLPVDEVKIDRSFIRDMLDDPADNAIVEGIIALARVYDLNLVAEGVESADQVDALLGLGCHIIQGYIIAKPMPASDFMQWVTDRNTKSQII